MNKSDTYSSKTFEFALYCYLNIACLKYEDKILVYRLTRGTNLSVHIVINIFIQG